MTTKLIADFPMAASVTSAVSKPTAVRTRVLWFGALALGAMIFGLSTPALAETLSISATGLVNRCPCGVGSDADSADESQGVFVGQKPNGRYFVPVVFPVTTGQKVCSFSMVYEDINAEDTMTARLFRKTYTVNASPFTAPTVMATVSSAAGVPATVRVATDTTITAPTITVVRTFYYIEVDIVTTNLNVLGFQIVYKPTCP